MKHIYLVQPNNILSNEVFLPYAVGALASYAWQFDDVSSTYELKQIFFKKERIESIIAKIDSPYLVGFSCYMWNVEYNLLLAKEIRKTWPNCIIVFGGPEIPEDTSYLLQNDFIDILLFGEGERSFCQILTAGKNYSGIYNIAYRRDKEIIQNPKKIFRDVSDFPSPYASGVFDKIIMDPQNADLQFDAILETNRGCPYGCIYCYWAGTENNFRVFPLDRVKKDLLWIAKNRIAYCMCADSNFGILERDREIAEFVVNLKREYGYPRKIETSSAKDKDDAVFSINNELQKAEMNCGISISVQSFSSTVLRNIGRRNISAEDFSAQLKRYQKSGIATHTDFILALPGETFESFCKGIFCAIENGQHNSINIHTCEVLPNTILALPQTREKYHIETIRSVYYQDHSLVADMKQSGSRSEIIVATDAMSRNEWRDAMRVSVCVQSFHSFGLLKCYAIYLRKAHSVSYYDFYMDFYNWLTNQSNLVKCIFDSVCNTIDAFLEEKSGMYYFNKQFSDAFLPFKEGVFLCSIYRLDDFYHEIELYIGKYFENNKLFSDLSRYQKKLIKTPNSEQEQLTFLYDWEQFFSSSKITTPKKQDTILLFDECTEKDWPTYTRNNIWYGKREHKMLRKVKRLS